MQTRSAGNPFKTEVFFKMEIEIRRTVNKKLVAFILSHGVQPIRLELDPDGKIIYVYDVSKTREIFNLWISQNK